MVGMECGKKLSKKYDIDYFGYAINLEFKFKLNFDQERGSKIEKKRVQNELNFAIIYKKS
jgi:hypothetical protein